MHIVIPDDYQDCVRELACFQRLKGHRVTVYNDTVRDLDTLVERFSDAEALVLIRERTPITEALLERLPKLRLISQTGKGIAHVDLDACTRRGVAVATGIGAPYAAAELTWGLVLAAMRHIPDQVAAMRSGRWQTRLGTGLRGRTLGVFGYGKVGSLVASYGRAFGMHLLVWGREGSLERAAAAGIDTAESQEDLFARADVLCLHLGLNPGTRGIVRAKHLALMKPTALLVNTARAELIEPDALVNALRAGRPGMAAVDVYEDEPVRDHPLLHLDNALCTPHLGYVERDGYELYFGAAFDNVLAFAEGSPRNLSNPEVMQA
ncbi:D-2-hydroxyacid dehydrogenase family protein [Thioalkalivibrio sulfidiphilus]|uniref:D-2-hydroxyacid dehydrogenase family protein n=1 Tax=Thioalkalivibrio sulfidiphilus TaxID=1033854 RepID=UPI00036F891F|nr:D-2-hydroxyacid dehydrogenase family protein [Thioalkalivibrio sulfidiphilus]